MKESIAVTPNGKVGHGQQVNMGNTMAQIHDNRSQSRSSATHNVDNTTLRETLIRYVYVSRVRSWTAKELRIPNGIN